MRCSACPAGYTAKLPEALAALGAGDVRDACRRNFKPDDAVTVAVTTADRAHEALSASTAGTITVVEHDAY